MSSTKEISVFVDESGSFDPDRQSSRYYMICMVFHNQDIDISQEINALEDSLESIGGTKNFKKNYLKLLNRKRFV